MKAHYASDRDEEIRKTAYLKAEEKGFPPGCDQIFWLEAELEYDRTIAREFYKETEEHFGYIVAHIKESRKILESIKPIKNRFSWFVKSPTSSKVSADVYERLMLRYAILSRMEVLEHQYILHNTLTKENNTKQNSENPENKNDRNSLAYRFATTDLFVEKAIIYLEHDYRLYLLYSKVLTVFSFIPLVLGVIFSFLFMYANAAAQLQETIPWLTKISSNVLKLFATTPASDLTWTTIAYRFIIAFTFYGFLVLLSVACWRHSKAMMDQAERLKERRHSLRQGRLYIHLNDGRVNVDELEKAFEWNVSKGNAFANIPTEASAPWGAVIKEFVKNITDTIKAVKEPKNKS